MPEIIRITSEALQATVRRLLPSQQGFGDDLQASNVITPIIDLTPSAEGSTLPDYLQSALAFGSQTSFSASNASATLANTAGFWRILGTSNIIQSNTANSDNKINMSDGFSTKTVFVDRSIQGSNGSPTAVMFDLTVYLDVGESVSVVSSNANALIAGSYRQVADTSGNLVNPSGFNPQ